MSSIAVGAGAEVRSIAPPVSNSAFAATQLEWDETRLPAAASGPRRLLAAVGEETTAQGMVLRP